MSISKTYVILNRIGEMKTLTDILAVKLLTTVTVLESIKNNTQI